MSAFAKTIAEQRRAADPRLSAFVAANAGAGKTRVLTDRVARLLLSGAPPDRILCITYTKAAAAEMAERLFAMLGGWALADDATLADAMTALDGDAAAPRDFPAARRLFARALDTPGGLKIQTIHAFCERVLRRFPLEAGVAPNFSVLTEEEARTLARAAFDHVVVRDMPALRRVSAVAGPNELPDLIVGALTSRARFDALPPSASRREALARRLSLEPDADESALLAAAAGVLTETDVRRTHDVFRQGGKNAQSLAAESLAAFLLTTDLLRRYEALSAFFLTKAGELRAKLGDAQTKAIDPELTLFLETRQAAFWSAHAELRAARTLEDTLVFIELASDARADYERAKRHRAALDFDDLVSQTLALFSERDMGPWVLYKLDHGIDHVLLDEAQDTSPAQWGVLERLLEELLAGDGARARGRTFFAVGDQKQSIYAFQGADARLFDAKRTDLGEKLATVGAFAEPELKLSFRSAAPVLAFVDALFAEDGARAGLGAKDGVVEHFLKREGVAGHVEVWPLTPRTEEPDTAPWDAPLDQMSARDPIRLLTEAVAAEIEALGEERARGAPVRHPPGDVLILVQARSALFHEMIKTLARWGLPVAGADRIKLLEDAAVENLLAYARAVLLETDDLSLAELLKSPFFNLDDDALFALAYGRAGTLSEALRQSTDPRCRDAAAEIAAAREIGLRDGAFAFFSHVLEHGAPSGRRRLYVRLGGQSRESVEELLRQALDYERQRARSLRAFVDFFVASAGEIKREQSEKSDAIRVMTVHGAKGLQAPVVFLLDAHRAPRAQGGGRLIDLAPKADVAAPPLFVLARSKAEDCPMTEEARARRMALEYEEYRRKLYVAATRAEDRLYVCGLAPARGDPGARDDDVATWHELSVRAMRRCAALVDAQGPFDGETLILSEDGTRREEKPRAVALDFPPPAWLYAPPAAHEPSGLIAASAISAAADPALPPDRKAFQRGTVIHRLLQLLPETRPAERPALALALAARFAPDRDERDRERWAAEALAVLEDKAFAELFAPGGRAEVALSGRVSGPAGLVDIVGVVDRLVVTSHQVFAVEYKTNRPPPERVEAAPRAYLAQLGAYRALLQQIYPGKEIICCLLWTHIPRLMAAPAELLDHALRSAMADFHRPTPEKR